MTFGETRNLLQSLRARELDVLIATQQIAGPGFVYLELFEERFLLVGSSKEEDVSDLDPISAMQTLQNKSWIAYSSELPIIRRYWREAFGKRATMQPQFVVPDLRTLKKLVMLGKGITVLPDYLVTKELEEGMLKPLWNPARSASNPLWLVYRSSDRDNALLMNWIEHMRQAHSLS